MPAAPGQVGKIMGNLFNWLGGAGMASATAKDSMQTRTYAHDVKAGLPRRCTLSACCMWTCKQIERSGARRSDPQKLIKPMLTPHGWALEQIGQWLSCGLPA